MWDMGHDYPTRARYMDDLAACTLLWPCALMIQDERLETSFSPKNYGQRSPCACGHDGRFFALAFICRMWCNACINQGMACLVSQAKSTSFSCTRNKFSTMCWDELLTQIPDDVCSCLLLFTSAHWRKKKLASIN